MIRILLTLALFASSPADAADVYTVPADALICVTEEAYDEQSTLLSAGVLQQVQGCGELINPLRVVVLEMNILGPSYVRSIDPEVRFWVGTTDLKR